MLGGGAEEQGQIWLGLAAAPAPGRGHAVVLVLVGRVRQVAGAGQCGCGGVEECRAKGGGVADGAPARLRGDAGRRRGRAERDWREDLPV